MFFVIRLTEGDGQFPAGSQDNGSRADTGYLYCLLAESVRSAHPDPSTPASGVPLGGDGRKTVYIDILCALKEKYQIVRQNFQKIFI